MERSAPQVPHLYNLTKVTGKRKTDDRTVVIQTFEMNRRRFHVSLMALGPAVLLTLPFAFLFGIWSLFVFMALMVAAILLFDYRTSGGMRVTMYATIQDRRKSLTGSFMQSGEVLDDAQFEQFQVLRSTVTLQRPDVAEEAHMALLGEKFDPLAAQHEPVVVAATPPAPKKRRTRRARKSRGRAPANTSSDQSISDFSLDGII